MGCRSVLPLFCGICLQYGGICSDISGTETVRLYAATNMPTPFNLYGSPEFVFNCTNTFPDRFDPHDELYFTGQSTRLGVRLSQSNFIPSVLQMNLEDYNHRGPGTNMYVLMAGGRFVAHVSEFPVATYKKGHGFSGTGTTTGGVSRTGLQSENSYLFQGAAELVDPP